MSERQPFPWPWSTDKRVTVRSRRGPVEFTCSLATLAIIIGEDELHLVLRGESRVFCMLEFE